MTPRIRVAILALPLPIIASAAAFAEEAARPAANGPSSPDLGQYRIGPEDLLQISVWKNEAMSRNVPVRPDGKISLPLLNDVQAAGLTALGPRDAPPQNLTEDKPHPRASA